MLEDSGEIENTWIIYPRDHGEMLRLPVHATRPSSVRTRASSISKIIFYASSSPSAGRIITIAKTPARPHVSHRFGLRTQ